MNATPQPTPPQERRPQQHRYSTESRLAIVETRWQDVIPTLATKADLREANAETKAEIVGLQTEITLIRKDMQAMEQRLMLSTQSEIALVRKDMEAITNKLVIRMASIMGAGIGITAAIIALIQKFL